MTPTAERAENVASSIDAAVLGYCEDRGRDDTRTKGRGFAIWCLTEIFGFERDDAIDAILDGRDDRSIDALADDGNRLIVLQSKYNSHGWDKVTQFQEDVRAVASGAATNLPARLKLAAATIRARQASELPIAYYYITNLKFSGGDNTRVATLGDDPPIEALDLDKVCDLLAEREATRPPSPPRDLKIRPVGTPLEFDGSLIFPVPLREFSRFVNEGKTWLFDSNVRQYLVRSKINDGIRNTVEGQADRFWRYNNGVTMVVDAFTEMPDGAVQLTAPQIVNGCQTSLSVAMVVNGLDVNQEVNGSVLIRVIREPSDAERQNITKYTNLQNAVRGKDFFALQDFQRSLAQKINALGYFYEIQTGSFDMLSESKKEALKGDPRYSHLEWKRKDYRIKAIEAAKCFGAAFKNKVAACYANPGDLAPNGKFYDDLFPNDLPGDPEPYLLPFLLMKHAEQRLKYGTANLESWRSRGRYMFVFVAFRVLRDALRRAGRLKATETDLSTATLREAVASEDIANGLVSATDEIMKGFFTDSAIVELVNEDIFAFLKGPVETPDVLKILDLKVRQTLDGPDGKELVGRLRGALPTQANAGRKRK